MTHAQFLRIKKLTGKAIIEVAARHNHREILAEKGAAKDSHIDPARTELNRCLRGCDTAAGVASEAQTLMSEAGVKATRKDAVRALEIIFSLPPQSSIDHDRFFDEAVQWTGQYFKVPVISAIVHHDEAAPHCHVLLLPLVGGRMVGSDLMGGRAKLQALQADFHVQVGQGYGLTRQAPQKRLGASIRRQAIDSAFDALATNSGLNNALLRVLVDAHLNNPEPLMMALGLDMPKPKVKGTFAGIMTKPCKPEKPIGFTRSKPIGFDDVATPEKEQTLSCVGFDKITPSFSPPNAPQMTSTGATMMSKAMMMESDSTLSQPAPASTTSAARPSPKELSDTPTPQPTDTEGDYVRERDDDQPSGYWDESTGDFIKPTVKASCKPSITAVVHAALQSIGRYGAPGAMRC